MKTLTKLGAFVAALLLVFGSAYVVGRIAGPPPGTEPVAAAAPAAAAMAEEEPNGLSVSHESMTLKVLTGSFPAGATQNFEFQILQHDGTPLIKYQPKHDKLMHLIIARRDLSVFQHIHPNLGPDGVWRVPLTLPEAGEYKMFADYMPMWGIHNETLGADISVSGNYVPRALPAPSNTATVDGYTVTMKGTLAPAKSSKLTLSVAKDGKPVTDLEPYLAAYGHVVALRDGDLSYMHLHPDGTPGNGKTKPGPDISFFATPPTFGDYRFFLDFQHQGVVRTAAFTVHVGGTNPPPHGLTEEQFKAAKDMNEKAYLNGGGPTSAGTVGTGGGAGHGHG
jgi:hypothetical protein